MYGSRQHLEWLSDADVRDGIWAMLKQDQCAEEAHRICHETENLTHWLQREIAAVELVLRMPFCKSVTSLVTLTHELQIPIFLLSCNNATSV